MAVDGRAVTALCLSLTGACLAQAPTPSTVIPPTQATTLAGQSLHLPQDLSAPATVFIIGFGRHSQDATTAWEKPVRTQLAKPGSIGFYDVAMLSEVPGFVRPMVMRMVKSKVPDVLKPNFLPLTESEVAWKSAAGYTSDQPEAAYVLIVDRSGHIRWATHTPYSQSGFAELQRRTAEIAGSGN